MDSLLQNILSDLMLPTLIERFKQEKIDAEMILSLSDNELIRLGMDTIGDRYRLREKVAEQIKLKTTENVQASGVDNELDRKVQQTRNMAQEIRNERALLFGQGDRRKNSNICTGTFTSRTNAGNVSSRTSKRAKRSFGWTANFVCLSHTNTTTVPTATEKDILHKAGLGAKQIRLEKDDDEANVLEKIMSEELNNDLEVTGFPQLKDAGGIELLRTRQNCRNLTLINCCWSVRELRAHIGAQSNIYIRPIQKNLSTQALSVNESNSEKVKTICNECSKEFLLRELRQHLKVCIGPRLIQCTAIDDEGENDSDSLPDPKIDNNLTQNFESHGIRIFETIHNSSSLSTSTQMNVATGDYHLQNITNINPASVSSLTQETNSEAADPVIYLYEDFNSFTDVLVDPIDASSFSKTEMIANNSNIKTEFSKLIKETVIFLKSENITDPIEILRKLQEVVITGRPLEVENVAECIEGETSYIMIDRNNILQTGLDEINNISDEKIRNTLEVQFYNEVAVDNGGPRKELFQLILIEIKEKYFDHGLREILALDYITVGKVFALSILQNGRIPKFLDAEILQELVDNLSPSICIANLRTGLDVLGIVEICRQLPSFIFLFHHSSVGLTFRKMTTILKPVFTEEGSNRNVFEKATYSAFIRYLREVAGGRREPVTLHSVLQFVTGTEDEPVLGYKLQPCIEFPEAEVTFLPTANTCVNTLKLPRPNQLTVHLPEDTKLFDLYDYAFSNSYFGLK